jgi:NADH dehydrogenase FAD-containing subunit
LPDSPGRHRVVIAGAGFAGYNAARELSRVAGASTEITVINPDRYHSTQITHAPRLSHAVTAGRG